MADKCICCGKKIGLINGSHLDNKLCDNCYFPIDGYLSAIKGNNDISIIEDNYNQLIQKVQSSQYTSLGKEYILNYADTIINKYKEDENTKKQYIQLKENFKITTGNNIEGYFIKQYYSVISKSTFLGIGVFEKSDIGDSIWFGMESDTFSDKLEQARNSSINKMIDGAINQGGNALIGVSFDYINFTSNMIGVVANGTVVEIVKEDQTVNNN